MNQRLQYFDQMKGISIILVVIGHIMQFSFGFNPSDVVNMLGVFHMPIFFYISGYFMYKITPNSKEMLTKLCKRSLNLLVPYLVFAALWCAFSEENYIGLLLGGGGRYWFLWVLFLISSFFIVYGYLIRNIKNTWVYVAMWIIAYLLLIGAKIGFARYSVACDMLCIGHLVTYYRYFLIGYLCKRYMSLNNLLFNKEIIFAIGFVCYFLQWRFCDWHNMALIFLGGMGAIIVIQQFFQRFVKDESKVGLCLSSIGKMSLAIYVIHYFFIPDISGVMHNFLNVGNPFIWQFAFAVLLAIPIIAASMFVGKLIEMNSYLNFIFFGKTFKITGNK